MSKDYDTLVVVVTYVHVEKGIFGFLDVDGQKGFTKAKTLPAVGQSCKLIGKKEREFFNLHSVSVLEEPCEETKSIKKSHEGILKLPSKGEFGFVGKVFASPALIRSCGAKEGDRVEGVAVLESIPGKSEKGWKMVTMNRISS
jgi:hypothetical protein